MFKTYPESKLGRPGTGVPTRVARSGIVGSMKKRSTSTHGSKSRGNSSDHDYMARSMRLAGDFGVERYNPAYDRLEEGSVVEDWIPRDAPGLHRLMRRIYQRDDVGGPMVDIYKEMAWSKYDLQGIDDRHILQPFEESLDNLDPLSLMPAASAEVLMIGRCIYGLAFDSRKGVFTHAIPHDPDFLRITPVPIHGYDPLVDLRDSPGWKNFTSSDDPRMTSIRSTLPASMISGMKENAGWTPLDPLTTIFMRRQSNSYDLVGTSIYTRLINFIAIQKALIDTTVIALRRRAAGVLHIRVGSDKWEATDGQLSDIAGLWMQAEEDQGGGIVVTRDGVETDRSQSAVGDIWKFSDEYPFLSEGKMRALGISDAFLSGDATFSNMEMALSVFMERLRGFREHMTNQMIIRRVFHTLARAHGFIKPEDNSPQGRRNAFLMSHRRAMEIPVNRLIIPELVWHKSLHPVGDESQISILERLKENGLPVTKQHMATAAGFDLKKGMLMMDEDIEQENKVREWKTAIEGGEEEGIFGRVRLIPHPIQNVTKPKELRTAAPKALDGIGYFNSQDKFLTLGRKEAQRAFKKVLPLLAKKEKVPTKMVMARTGISSTENRHLFRYLMVRLGYLPGYAMGRRRMGRISHHLTKTLNPKLAFAELELLAKTCGSVSGTSDKAPQSESDWKPRGPERKTGLPTGPSGTSLLSGVVPKNQKDV